MNPNCGSRRDLVDLTLGMRPRVARIGLERADGSIIDGQLANG